MAATMDIKVPRNYLDVLQEQRGGFSFENCKRNQFLLTQAGIKPPTAMKSGTTICGVIIKDGVVVAADTRATMGPIVSDKNCEKLHRMADNMYCAGAGTSADLEHTTQLMEGQMELFRMSTGTTPRVCTVVKRLSTMLFKYQGYVGCALILGGYDPTGPHLYSIAPHGSTDKLPFATMGSGSLHAMAVLEGGYKDDMTKEEGVALVTNAIRAGILHDLGSGSNVDVCVITKDGADMKRNVDTSAPFMGMGGKDKLIKGQLRFPRSVLNDLVLKETRKRLTKPADEDVEMEG